MADNTFELKENQVMIFKNEKREKDSHPEYKGKMNVNGEIMDVSLWVKTGTKSGKKYFSGTVQPEWKPTQASTPPPPPPPPPAPVPAPMEMPDDDLPF